MLGLARPGQVRAKKRRQFRRNGQPNTVKIGRVPPPKVCRPFGRATGGGEASQASLPGVRAGRRRSVIGSPHLLAKGLASGAGNAAVTKDGGGPSHPQNISGCDWSAGFVLAHRHCTSRSPPTLREYVPYRTARTTTRNGWDGTRL